MTVHINSFFSIGQTHNVCQDYAAAKLVEIETENAITHSILAVSDGCSSSPDTDIGSRLLVQHSLNTARFGVIHGEDVIFAAFETSSRLQLSRRTLDATLLIAQIDQNRNLINTKIWGDGVVWVKYKDGKEQTIDIEFSNNAPAYLSYFLTPDLINLLLESKCLRTVTDMVAGREPIVSVDDTSNQYEWSREFCLSDVDTMMIFSDGIKSFRKKVNGAYQNVPLADVLKEVTAIKNYNGEFMVRRMKKFLHEFCPKNSWIHEDDVAVAAMVRFE